MHKANYGTFGANYNNIMRQNVFVSDFDLKGYEIESNNER